MPVTLLTRVLPVDLGNGFSFSAVRRLPGVYRVFTTVILAMSFCYMGAEAIPNNRIPKYLDDIFPASARASAADGISGFRSRLILSPFRAAVTVGRRICAVLLDRWRKPIGLLGASLTSKEVGFVSEEALFCTAVAMGALPFFVIIAFTRVMKRIISLLDRKRERNGRVGPVRTPEGDIPAQ